MSLDAAVRAGVGDLLLDVELTAPSGEVTAVLGPNGAGKTSLLRALAGTLPIESGTVVLDGRVLDAPPEVRVVPEQRRLGIVHQDLLLFPHLSALENVAFGPRSQGRGAHEARAVAAGLLERVGLAHRADARPGSLSGGEAQRVALARALAAEPAALLLDEPLAALDAGTRVEVRRELRAHVEAFGGPTLLVTHDPVDVLALADRVAILEEGRITQAGGVAEVTSRPRSRYVAQLIGTNLLRGVAAGTAIETDAGLSLTAADAQQGDVFATIAPAAIALHRHPPEGSPRNRWRAAIDHLDLLGDRVRVHLGPPVGLVAEITPAAVTELGLREGEDVWVSVKATEVSTYPR